MKKIALFTTTLTIAVMSLSCFSHSNPSQIALNRIDSLFTSLFPDNEPGAAVLILKGDSFLFNKGFGLADMERQIPVDGTTFFNIASVSKQFSGVGLMILAQDGKLTLDDPVQKFFPTFKAPFFKEITLKHLLSHTSGIPDSRPRSDRHFVLTATDVESYSYLQELNELNFLPGCAYEYMNPTFQLMYSIIEQCSGQSFDDFMKERIFLPAKMEETTYFEADKFIPRMAHGYRRTTDGKWAEYDYGEASFFATKADGGLYTSVEEFVLWEKALRNNILIPATVLEEAHTAHINIPETPFTGYGYGWFIEEKPGFPKKVYHTGDNGGFHIYAGRYPEQEVLLLIFATRNDWDREATVERVDQMMKEARWLD